MVWTDPPPVCTSAGWTRAPESPGMVGGLEAVLAGPPLPAPGVHLLPHPPGITQAGSPQLLSLL